MCGIVGYLGRQQAQDILLDCLGRLEYRGYDSVGMAAIEDGKLATLRNAGDHSKFLKLAARNPLPGHVGIAHTRWATHGRATTDNSHPHTDCHGEIAIVHNGIIENHLDLREELESDGHRFLSQTDSEVIAHLLESNISAGPKAAVREVVSRLEGSYALAMICQSDPARIIIVRHGGPPLVIGHCEDGIIVSSDIAAILHYTRDIQVLEDNEIAELTAAGADISIVDGTQVTRPKIQIAWENDAAEKRGFDHFMLKEIHEQPQAVISTIRGQNLHADGSVSFPHAELLDAKECHAAPRISMVACGSSWHAALVGKYLIEKLAGTFVNVDLASEYRYRPELDSSDKLVIGISQSGETADTLGALSTARARGARVVSICNFAGSTMCRESDGVIYTHAGPEIGVASTKTFLCQLTAMLLMAIGLAVSKGKLSASAARGMHRELLKLPFLIKRVLGEEEKLTLLAEHFDEYSNALYIGRGNLYPIAIEGALKLKEISYIHAEAYAAGELKHGSIALIDSRMPVVALATQGPDYARVVSAIQEIKARDGIVTAIATEGDGRIAGMADHVFYLPKAPDNLMPMLMAVPLQLLAYYIARRRECPIDKPRNLAKSVTVE